jgi:hypothetical protein
VGGITRETFVPESLILPQGIPELCDDPGLRTVILATLLTLDESGVVVRQNGGREPLRRIQISDAQTRGPQPASAAHSATPIVALSPLDKGKGAASSTSIGAPPKVAPGGRRRRGDASYVALTGRSLRSLPRSARGSQAGPRRRVPRATVCRGASVRRRHHHRSRRHHHHRYHRTRRHHHHLGVISTRGTSSNNNSSSSNNSKGGDPASRVTGRSMAPSKCSPFYFELNRHVNKS